MHSLLHDAGLPRGAHEQASLSYVCQGAFNDGLKTFGAENLSFVFNFEKQSPKRRALRKIFLKMPKEEIFVWTDAEVELLSEVVKLFASDCLFDGLDWEGCKAKYEKIRKMFIERYPKAQSEDFPKSLSLETISKGRICIKVKSKRVNFKKAVDKGRRIGGGRIVMTFYNLCSDIWAGAPANKSLDGKLNFFHLFILYTYTILSYPLC